MTILISWFPMILLIGVWIFHAADAVRRQEGDTRQKPHETRDRQVEEVTFADVAGIDEASPGGYRFSEGSQNSHGSGEIQGSA